MAIRYAANTGNWSSLATWDGGASKPASGDTVVANGKTVTIDEDVDLGSGTIQTLAAGAAASGGGFIVNSDRTLTMNALAGTTICLTGNTGNMTFNGSATGSAATSSRYGLNFTSSGTLTFNGNGNGGAGSLAHGINVQSGTANITGTMTGGASSGAGLNCTGGTITYSGNPIAHATSGSGYGVLLSSSPSFTWSSGTGTPGTACEAIKSGGSAALTVTQSISLASGTKSVVNTNGGSAIFNGSVTATAGAYPPITGSNNTMTFNSTLTAANGVPIAILSGASSTITVTGNMVASSDGTQVFTTSTSLSVKFKVHPSNTQTIAIPDTGGGTRTLSTASGGLMLVPGLFGGMARTN